MKLNHTLRIFPIEENQTELSMSDHLFQWLVDHNVLVLETEPNTGLYLFAYTDAEYLREQFNNYVWDLIATAHKTGIEKHDVYPILYNAYLVQEFVIVFFHNVVSCSYKAMQYLRVAKINS